MSIRRTLAVLAAGALATTGLVFAAPLAATAADCDAGGFEIDGDLPSNCEPTAFEDWDTVGYAGTNQGGTYKTAGRDVDNPTTWELSGATPDKADFDQVYSYAQVGNDGHYWVYVGWTRTQNSGTAKYVLDLTFSDARFGPDGAPQPDHGAGGVVTYIEMDGGDPPVLGQLCPYDSQTGYPDAVNPLADGCTDEITGFASAVSEDGTFFEVSLDLTEFADIEPDCPPSESVATLYLRSLTGGNDAGNLKGFVDPLGLTPPSTCGYLSITKKSLDDRSLEDTTLFDYDVYDAEDPYASGDLMLNETDTYYDIEPGDDYTLNETLLLGSTWTLHSIVCTLGETEYVLYENGDYTGIEFPAVSGELTECVITNAAPVLPATGPADTAVPLGVAVLALLAGVGAIVLGRRRTA